MENAIKFLRIQNFKSIKDVTLHPRRVNLIIGEPNVGKSNLLEAMTLLGGITYEQTEKFMGSFIRYDEPRQLFYDNLVANTIKVETDKDVALIFFEKRSKTLDYFCINKAFYDQLSGGPGLKIVGSLTENKEDSIVRKIPRNYNEIGGLQHDGADISKVIHVQFDTKALIAVNGETMVFQYWDGNETPSIAYTFRKGGSIN